MGKQLRSFVIFLLFALPRSADAGVYTLDYLVEEANRQSFRLQRITSQVEQAELSLQLVYGSWFPRISFGAEFNHLFTHFIPYRFRVDESTGQPVVGDWAGRLEDIIEIPPNVVSGSLSLVQPIFMQARTGPLLRAGHAGQMQLICSYQEEKDRIRCETTKMYYRVLLEQERLLICREKILLAEESHRLTKVNLAFDRVRELDSLTSLLHLEQARSEGKSAERARRCAAEALMVNCGITGSATDFRVDGTFPEPVFFITLEEALDRLHRDNRRIKQFRGSETIMRERITLAKTGYLPTVYGGAAIGRFGQFSTPVLKGVLRWDDDQRAFIGLSWNIFSGLSQQKIIRQRVIDRDTLLMSQRNILNELELTTRTAFDRVMAAMEQLSALETIIDISNRRYGMAKKAFEVGTASQLELQNAELELSKAKLQRSEGLFEFHTAVAEFKFIIGSQW